MPDGDDDGDEFDDDTYGEFLKEQRATFQHALPDGMLAFWVSRANSASVGREHGIEVTLFVGGLMVSGRVVSVAAYLHGLSEAWPGEVGDAFREWSLESQLEIGHNELTTDDLTDTRFIHLLDAVVVLPGQSRPLLPIPPWRGRLSSVDAWCWGALEPMPAD